MRSDRTVFRQHPKWGTLESDADGERVTITEVEILPGPGLIILTFASGPKKEIVCAVRLRNEGGGAYALKV